MLGGAGLGIITTSPSGQVSSCHRHADRHTHSAPGCYGFPDGQGGFAADLGYLGQICVSMAEAVNKAMDSLAATKVKISTDDARGKIAYNYYAKQLYDPHCDVIQFLDNRDRTFAALVNYAVHPEVLGAEAGLISPDLVGPLCNRITEKGGGIGIFINGAQGGMIAADNRTESGKDARTWSECVRIGTLLAGKALRIIKKAPLQSNPFLNILAWRVFFPVASPFIRQIMKLSLLGYVQGAGSEVSVNVITFGNAQILTIPGEALPNIGYYLKRQMKGEYNLLFGFTNNVFGYIPAQVDWGSFRRYDLTTRTSLGGQTGKIFIRKALRLIIASPAPAPATID
ncbi:MAG: hypothetical protein M2R45_02449 [Verrucomicrobia subdivision 3 bacterium]|nr:hypothetical protein [Limisphaerales bacterium]MCS1416346.1 hypothetical protein [Limisphaerales bacterium]